VRARARVHVYIIKKNNVNYFTGTNPPITVIEEKNGVSVVLHFAQDSPRSDVSVIVITTMSKNTKPLNNYLFQAVVSKVSIQNLKFSKFPI